METRPDETQDQARQRRAEQAEKRRLAKLRAGDMSNGVFKPREAYLSPLVAKTSVQSRTPAPSSTGKVRIHRPPQPLPSISQNCGVQDTDIVMEESGDALAVKPSAPSYQLDVEREMAIKAVHLEFDRKEILQQKEREWVGMIVALRERANWMENQFEILQQHSVDQHGGGGDTHSSSTQDKLDFIRHESSVLGHDLMELTQKARDLAE